MHCVSTVSGWYRAVNLRERLEHLSDGGLERVDGENADRLRRWRAQAPFGDPVSFSQRLAADGLDDLTFGLLLGEPAELLRDRMPAPPGWMTALDRAFSRAGRRNPASLPIPAPNRGQGALLDCVAPLVEQGLERLRAGLQQIDSAFEHRPFDRRTIVPSLLDDLPARLLGMMRRTLVLELNVARLEGVLHGATAEEQLEDFGRRLRRRESALALLEEYPVLARQLTDCIGRRVEFIVEFLAHLCADWQAVLAAFSSGSDLGVAAKATAASEAHRGGRSVLIVEFTSGAKIVYKPRPIAVEARFQDLLAWLNARGDHPPFRTLTVLDRGRHGWVEHVAAEGCRSPGEVRRFYERQGGYLALLYALGGTDIHGENLIAAGEHPVLVDVETLFLPASRDGILPGVDMPAAETMGDSLLRVGLLPVRVGAGVEAAGPDLSGLGGGREQILYDLYGNEATLNNRPALDGDEIDVLDFTGAIASGFAGTYRLLAEHRGELLADRGPLMDFADREVRVVLRNTRTYARLLQDSFHPDVLRDALDRDRLFDRLWVRVPREPALARAIPAEQADLWRGDIPVFTTSPSSRDLWTSSGGRIADYFDEPGLDRARRRIRRLGDDDLERQLWLIRASFATLPTRRRPSSGGVAPSTRSEGTADPDSFLAVARAVGDRLESLASRGAGDDQITWIGLMPVGGDGWSLNPLGLDLYGGVPGVAWFLAYLGAITGVTGYTATARAALALIRRRLNRDRSLVTSIGGFDGWGGLIYVYSHLAALWGEPALLAEADAMVERLDELVDSDEHLDVIKGAAGAIGGLLCLHRCSRSRRALEVAIRCGDRLIRRARPQARGTAWPTSLDPAGRPLTGFSHGAAGMAWALSELAAATGEVRFRNAAAEAIAFERSLFSAEEGNWPDLRPRGDDAAGDRDGAGFMVAWCHGAPGIALARLKLLEQIDSDETRAEIEVASRTTLMRGFGDNHSLCHGDLGNLEPLLRAAEFLPDPRMAAECHRVAAAILEEIRGTGWRCGTPFGVETPGLMIGLAGIGYGMLRLAEPGRVPSVLILEPPRRAAIRLGT